MIDKDTLDALIDRVSKATRPDNRLDIAIDIALFKPDAVFASVRPNAAGTKLVYTRHDRLTRTFCADDHTLSPGTRDHAVSLLLALLLARGEA